MEDDNSNPSRAVRSTSAASSLANRLRPSSKRIRSAVTNGERAFVVGDGNSPWGRRQRDLVALNAEDAGGIETLSAAQLSLCQRAATIETELELLEGQMSLGKAVDLDMFGRLSGHLRRILETLGVKRVKRDVTPDFRTYVASKSEGGPQ